MQLTGTTDSWFGRARRILLLPLWSWTLVLFLTLAGLLAVQVALAQNVGAAAQAQEDAPSPVLQAGSAPRILALLAPIVIDTPLPDGLIVDSVRIDRDRVTLEAHALSAPKAAAVLSLLLLPKGQAEPGDTTSASFAIRTTKAAELPAARALAQQLIGNIVAHDQGNLYLVQAVRKEKEQGGPSRDGDKQRFALAGLVFAILLSGSIVWRRYRTGRWPVYERRVQLNHFLPAGLQLIIFAYWSLYWREMTDIFPMIALEVLAALLLDTLLHLWREDKLVLSGGALPITLSTNLFVIFAPGGAWLSLLAVAVALLTKHFVRSSRGHVFNPSAIGLLVVGVASLLIPQLGYGDTVHEFSLAPNVTELILILALVVQFRLPVVLVSIGAFLGLHLVGDMSGRLAFDPIWAPIALVITLLVTDPATQPKSPLGRLAFGLLAGVLMRVSGEFMLTYLNQGFWGKAAGVALANLCVPWIDLLIARLPEQMRDGFGLLAPRLNPVHIAVWWILMVGNLLHKDSKAAMLQYSPSIQLTHIRNGTPFLQPALDGKHVFCPENRLFCDPFTFPTELACWLGNDKTPACGTGRSGPPGIGHKGPSQAPTND